MPLKETVKYAKLNYLCNNIVYIIIDINKTL